MSTVTVNKITIVKMEILGQVRDEGKDFPKTLPPGNRYRYSVEVRYTGECGTEFVSRIRGLTRPKLAANIASNERYVANRMLRYEKYGEYWNQMLLFKIGG